MQTRHQKHLIIFLLISAIPFGLFAQNKPYKGAELYSFGQHEITYGKIEARIRAANGSGILSTLFTWKEGSEQSAVFWEELDVEIFGKNNATSWQSNIITGFDPRQTSERVHQHPFSFAEEYHTFAIEWTPEYIAWFLDGQEMRRTTGAPATDVTSPAGIRLNLWAATDANWAGAWDDNVLPQHMFVNWVKYYELDNGQFNLAWTDNFDTFNSGRWGKANWTFGENRADFDPLNLNVQDGKLILSITKAGETGFSGIAPPDPGETTVSVQETEMLPQQFHLDANYPNPFNPETRIGFHLAEPAQVQLTIYNLLGQPVKTLAKNDFSVGQHSTSWDARDDKETLVGSGVYIYTIQATTASGKRYTQTKKMVLVR